MKPPRRRKSSKKKKPHEDENSPQGRFKEIVMTSKMIEEKRKQERAFKQFEKYRMQEVMPAVGQYDVERSRNLIENTQPVYTVPKSKLVDLQHKSQLTLPDIGTYENSDKAFT